MSATDRTLIRLGRDAERLRAALDRCRSLARDEPAERLRGVVSVSGWSAGQHLQHIALSLAANSRAIRELRDGGDDPDARPPRPGARLILEVGRIPRRRATAPESVVPEPAPDRRAVAAELERLAGDFGELASDLSAIAMAGGRIGHPVLGGFTAAQWLRFAWIHTEHHLRICEEILAEVPTMPVDRRQGLP